MPVLRARNYDGVADLVAEKVAARKGRISAKRLLPAARAAGYEGSARNFRRVWVGDGRVLRAAAGGGDREHRVRHVLGGIDVVEGQLGTDLCDLVADQERKPPDRRGPWSSSA